MDSTRLHADEGHMMESTPTYSAYDVFMVREVRLAVLAAVDLVAIEIDIVGETHGPDLVAGCAVFLRNCDQRWRRTSARAECNLRCRCRPGWCFVARAADREGRHSEGCTMSRCPDVPM
jgi:hypothetical protein